MVWWLVNWWLNITLLKIVAVPKTSSLWIMFERSQWSCEKHELVVAWELQKGTQPTYLSRTQWIGGCYRVVWLLNWELNILTLENWWLSDGCKKKCSLWRMVNRRQQNCEKQRTGGLLTNWWLLHGSVIGWLPLKLVAVWWMQKKSRLDIMSCWLFGGASKGNAAKW
jgi:hypothetical protein